MSKSKAQQIASKIEALRKEYLDTAKVEFHAGAKELFEKFGPRLKSFSIIGYTPYFNDGDECTYCSMKDEPNINGFGQYDDDDGGGDGENLYELAKKQVYTIYPNTKVNEKYDPSAQKIIDAVVEFTSGFEDEFYKDTFGDHLEVIVKPDGITTDEYNHD